MGAHRRKRQTGRAATAVALALVVIMLVPAAPAALAQQRDGDPCADVPESRFEDRDDAAEVHRPGIDCVDSYDIASGTGRDGRFFRPLRRVDRGQVATFLVATLEAAGLSDRLPAGDSPDEFDDIADNVHRRSINILARIDVARGSDDRYRPSQPVRRDQMASFLLHTAEWANDTQYDASGSHFGDVDEDNPHFETVNAAFEQGLLAGTRAPRPGEPDSGRYAPARDTLRQAMASLLSGELAFVASATAASGPRIQRSRGQISRFNETGVFNVDDFVDVFYDEDVVCGAAAAEHFTYSDADSDRVTPTRVECSDSPSDRVTVRFPKDTLDAGDDGTLHYDGPADATSGIAAPDGRPALTPQDVRVDCCLFVF